jgi:hypothetical protein
VTSSAFKWLQMRRKGGIKKYFGDLFAFLAKAGGF